MEIVAIGISVEFIIHFFLQSQCNHFTRFTTHSLQTPISTTHFMHLYSLCKYIYIVSCLAALRIHFVVYFTCFRFIYLRTINTHISFSCSIRSFVFVSERMRKTKTKTQQKKSYCASIKMSGYVRLGLWLCVAYN